MILASCRNCERKRRKVACAVVAAIAVSTPMAGYGQSVAQPHVAEDHWTVVVQSGYAPSSSAAEGLRLVALTGGRSLDLLTPDTWRSGPTSAGADETQVGVGWRRNRMSAVLGYVRETSNSDPGAFANDGGGRFKSRAMMGMGFALHY